MKSYTVKENHGHAIFSFRVMAVSKREALRLYNRYLKSVKAVSVTVNKSTQEEIKNLKLL